jgi:hypothetical protein
MIFKKKLPLVYLISHIALFFCGLWLSKVGDQFWSGIGIGCIGGSISGIFLIVYVNFSDTFADKIKMLFDLGLNEAHTKRGTGLKSSYDNRISKAKKRIWFLAYSGHSFRKDYCASFENWVQRKLDVRILLLEPDHPPASPLCSLRQQEDPDGRGLPDGRIKSEIERFVNDYKGNKKLSAPKSNFRMKYFKCIPSYTMVLVDNEILWGPYLVEVEGEESPTFIVRKGGDLFETFEDQFLKLWNNDSFSRDV